MREFARAHVSLAAAPVVLVVAYALLGRVEASRWTPALLFAIGTAIGGSATFVGAGADALVLPALLYTRLFSPQQAVATSMTVFLLPVQALTVVRAYQAGDLSIARSIVIALSFIAGNWITADHVDVTGKTVRYVSSAVLALTAVAILLAPTRRTTLRTTTTCHSSTRRPRRVPARPCSVRWR